MPWDSVVSAWPTRGFVIRVVTAVAALLLAGLWPQVGVGQTADAGLRIAVLADLNERYGDTHHRQTVHRAVARVLDWGADLVIVPGDMVAGQRQGLDYEAMWGAFHRAVSDPLRPIPVAVVPGNHDASAYPGYARERAVYNEVWRARDALAQHPGVAMIDGRDYPLRYSFTLGPAFFVGLDATTRDALAVGDQLDWLEAQLAQADPQRHPVRILFGHFPLYPVTVGRERDYLLGDTAVRERFAQIAARHGLSLYISGHHHGYYPGREPNSPLRLLSAGCLGGGPRPLIGEERRIADIEDPRERSLTWIQVDSDGQLRIEAFRGPDFGAEDRIERQSLPPAIGIEGMWIRRDDVSVPPR